MDKQKYNTVSIDTTVNYISPNETNPAYYLYETAPGYVPPPPKLDKTNVSIEDVRTRKERFNINVNGFMFLDSSCPLLDFLDIQTVKRKYYAWCENIVKEETGASEILAFDHNVRDRELAKKASAIKKPVNYVHNDYTEKSAPQRIKDLYGKKSSEYLRKRYCFINVWRPLSGPILDFPLGIIDAQTISRNEFIKTDLKYSDRTGEIYSVQASPSHRWYFLHEMHNDEVLLLKCFDTDSQFSKYTAHAAFHLPNKPKNAVARRSIEVRTIAFFD